GSDDVLLVVLGGRRQAPGVQQREGGAVGPCARYSSLPIAMWGERSGSRVVRRSSMPSSGRATQPRVGLPWSTWSQIFPPASHPIGRVSSVGATPVLRL